MARHRSALPITTCSPPQGGSKSAALARELAGRGLTVERIVSGSLRRQRDTAEPVAAALRRRVTVDPRWNEYEMDDVLAHHSTTSARASRPASGEHSPISSAEFHDLLERALNRVSVNTGITKLVSGRRGVTLVSFNEHTHLERSRPSLVTYR